MERLLKKLRKNVWSAIKDFDMIEKGDRIMVCISGGKDSYTLLDMLLHVQATEIYDFEIIAVNMDQKQPGFPEDVLPNYFESLGVHYKIIERDTYSIVMDKTPVGKTMCSLCSRLRRGTLYTAAEELGCNKLALGHHREDIIETLFLNLMFSGKLEAMPPKYRTDDGKHVVLRPLAYCKEPEIAEFAKHKEFPIIPCNLCGSQDGLQRQRIKKMLAEWEEQQPGRKEVIFNAIKNVSPSHLMDRNLFDFQSLNENILNS
ncbi:MAG: tRNA 2-thiocytidine(32) synthetase TtcA [Bacteroidota bacterium]